MQGVRDEPEHGEEKSIRCKGSGRLWTQEKIEWIQLVIDCFPGGKVQPLKRYSDKRLCHWRVKAAKGGESIEWHQDWAFYPHTNDNIVEVGIFLDDCYDDNGPLMAVPGSHKGPIDDHHYKEKFIGAVDPSMSNYDISTAISFLASAGSVSFHHVRSLHGSKKNNSNKSRRVLFIGYAAADWNASPAEALWWLSTKR